MTLSPSHSSHSLYSNGRMDPAVLINFSFSSFLSRVVRARALPTRRTLSAVEGNFCEAGLAGGAASTLYTIRCGTQAEWVLGGDSPCHEEGTGLDANKVSPMYGGSMSWNASEMSISNSSEGVVGAWVASQSQEVREPVRGKGRWLGGWRHRLKDQW